MELHLKLINDKKSQIKGDINQDKKPTALKEDG